MSLKTRKVILLIESSRAAGANLLMLDGHAEWRKFQMVHPRTLSGSPVFWW